MYILLKARTAPVMAPLAMELKGSSFFRRATSVHSTLANVKPQTAKLPATETN